MDGFRIKRRWSVPKIVAIVLVVLKMWAEDALRAFICNGRVFWVHREVTRSVTDRLTGVLLGVLLVVLPCGARIPRIIRPLRQLNSTAYSLSLSLSLDLLLKGFRLCAGSATWPCCLQRNAAEMTAARRTVSVLSGDARHSTCSLSNWAYRQSDTQTDRQSTMMWSVLMAWRQSVVQLYWARIWKCISTSEQRPTVYLIVLSRKDANRSISLDVCRHMRSDIVHIRRMSLDKSLHMWLVCELFRWTTRRATFSAARGTTCRAKCVLVWKRYYTRQSVD